MNRLNDLTAEVYPREPLLLEDSLISVADVLLGSVDEGSPYLLVAHSEEDRTKVRVDEPHGISPAVQRVSPPRRGLGRIVVVLMPLRASFYVSQARRSNPLELNRIGIEVVSEEWSGSAEPHVWLEQLVRNLVAAQDTRYGFACQRGEFYASNILSDDSGTRAIGRQFNSCLPGLYWLNYFGSECVAAMQPAAFHLLGAELSTEVGEGFLVRLAPDPSQWQQDAYVATRSRCVRSLGSGYFFSRDAPQAETVPIPFD